MISAVSSHHRRHRRVVAPEIHYSSSFAQEVANLKDEEHHLSTPAPLRHHEHNFSPVHMPPQVRHYQPIPFLNPRGDASHMQSRANALNRRCTNLSTALSHLASVVDVLRSTNYRNLTDAQIADVRAESDFVWKAVLDLEGGMIEVGSMLDEIEGQRYEGNVRDRQVWKEERVRERRIRGGDDGR